MTGRFYGSSARFADWPRKVYPSIPPTVRPLADEVAEMEQLRFCLSCAEMVPLSQFVKRRYGLSRQCAPCIAKAVA